MHVQAFESATLSLTELRQRSGFADPCKSRKNDITDALKTVFWFFSLHRVTGLETAYALERHFEPAAFGESEHGDPFHKNKWSGYQAGRHVPRIVLSAVEAKLPGANACLSNPLWAALTERSLTANQLEALLATLAPEIQLQVQRRRTSLHPRYPGMTSNHGLAAALERRASLDALAAAVVLLRIAHVKGETAAAYHWGRCLLRIMVMLGELLHAVGIARPLLELIDERVLPLAQHDGVRPGFPTHRFVEIAHRYLEALFRIRDKPFESMTEAQLHAAGQRMFDIKAGFDYFHAFNPIPVSEGTGTGKGSNQKIEAPATWLHTWALNMLSIGGHREAPPSAARTGEDLWATQEGTVAHRILEARAFGDVGTYATQ